MHVIIVGNGVAGVSCAMALRARDSNARITLVSHESPYFFSRTALMYAMMDRMQRKDLEPFERGVYDAQRICRLFGEVVAVDTVAKVLTVREEREGRGAERESVSKRVSYDRLVLATGALPNPAPWSGLEAEDLAAEGKSGVVSGIVHFVSLQDLDACEALVPSTREAVVVGGGLIGIELVECLRFHGIKTHFLIRESSFWPTALSAEEAALVVAEMRDHGVDVHLEASVAKVQCDNAGRVSGVITEDGGSFACQMLGVCIGVRPNLLLATLARPKMAVRRGILVNAAFQTSAPDVFACGDCAELMTDHGASFERPGVTLQETIWYSAKRQGECCALSILGDPIAYQPPLFFNSSKFFEMEYTTVGWVQAEANKHASLQMLHTRRRAGLRIVYEATSKAVLAFNVLGARVDHEVLMGWVRERRSLGYCRNHWRDAQFDVEFGRVDFEWPEWTRNAEDTP